MTGRKADDLSGAELILRERRRQIVEEEHDDRSELLRAAACYLQASRYPWPHLGTPPPWIGWPWSEEQWRPSADPVHNLAVAGALIAAEIDRLRRSKVTGARS